MNTINNFISMNSDVIIVFFIGIAVATSVIGLSAWQTFEIKQERDAIVSECVAQSPNNQNTIDHCMARYNFIMGK